MKAETLNEIPTYISLCHSASVEAGWWSDLRTGESLKGKKNLAEIIALIHSELSEALEGRRKGLKDDHLPSREMAEVELADTIIRIFDMAGGFDLDLAPAVVVMNEMMIDDCSDNFAEMISVCHSLLSAGYATCNNKEIFETNIAQVVLAINTIAEHFKYDLWAAVVEKVEYNKTREDHKIENRKKVGGKAF